jgi:hypothetical protein
MDRRELVKKITLKKEFSDLPKKDVELIFRKFDKKDYIDLEKVKLTRDLLRKIYSSFISQKLLSVKDRNSEWVLKKHLSTKERLSYYKKLYKKFFKGFEKNISVIDLGCGINGFSYNYFPKNFNVDYVGIEAIGQLVDLQNHYFKKEKIKGKVIHGSLFDLKKIKFFINCIKTPKVIFLFKTVDSLEMLKRDYSKKLLLEVTPLVNQVVVSFATKSLVSRCKFRVSRKWFFDFIKENFKILSDFELGDEKYLIFSKR